MAEELPNLMRIKNANDARATELFCWPCPWALFDEIQSSLRRFAWT